MKTLIVGDQDRLPRGIIYEIHTSAGKFTLPGIIHDALGISGRVIKGPFVVKNPVQIHAEAGVSLIILLEETQDFSDFSEMKYFELPCDQTDIKLPLNVISKIDLIANAEGARNIYLLNAERQLGMALNDLGQFSTFSGAFPRGAGSRIDNFVQSYDNLNIAIPEIIHSSVKYSNANHRVGFYCKENPNINERLASVLGIEITEGIYHVRLANEQITHFRIAGAPGAKVIIISPEIRVPCLILTEDILDVCVPLPEGLSPCNSMRLEVSDAIYFEVGVAEAE